MKILMCSLITVFVGAALRTGAFADFDETHHLVTGTVVLVTQNYMEVDTHDGGSSFGVFVERWGSYKPKAGDNVKVISGRADVASTPTRSKRLVKPTRVRRRDEPSVVGCPNQHLL